MKRLTILGLLAASVCMQPRAQAQLPDLPDLAPMGLASFGVTQRLGGPTLEFSILTANIGGQDFVRPADPDMPTQFLLTELYEYALYNEQDGEFVEIDRRRKPIICTIDDPGRGNVFPCIQEHGRRFGCSGRPGTEGISRGWADDYFRGLQGQWVFIGSNTGRFRLEAILDPNDILQREDLPDMSRDGDPSNNVAIVTFTYDDELGLRDVEVTLGFDPDAVCPIKSLK